MVYFIDTNVFIRVLELENEKMFEDCSGVLRLIRDGEIKALTSNLVLSEVVWVLGSFYNEGKEKVIKGLNSIINIANLKIIDKFNSNESLDLYSNHSVKYIDSLICTIPEIKSKKMTVISYDKDFDKLGVKRIEPLALLSS